MTTSTVSDSSVDSPVGAANGEAAPARTAETAGDSRVASDSVMAAPASAARTKRTMSILALSLGIASFFFAQSVVVPLAAIILGVFGLRDEPSGRSFSIWGIVLATVATFGWVVIVVAGAIISLPFLLFAAL
jgi:hypothetical protein